MTTYVGKDVDIFLGANQVLYAQELSFEIDNGQLDVREISSDTVKEFVWTKIAISGSLKIRPQSSGNFSLSALYNLVLPSDGLPTSQPTDDIQLKFGDTPDFTLTLTDVSWGQISCSIGIEEPVEFEMPFVAKASTLT